MSLTMPTDAAVASGAASLGVVSGPVDHRDVARARRARAHRSPSGPHRLHRSRRSRAQRRRCRLSASDATNPAPSVLEPTNSSPSQLTVLTELQRPRRRLQSVDGVDDGGLVRHRDRHPRDPQHAHRLDCLAASAVRHVERGVRPVDPRRSERGPMDDRRQAVGDGRSDQDGEAAQCGDRSRRPGHEPGSRAFSTLASCCSLVEANT